MSLPLKSILKTSIPSRAPERDREQHLSIALDHANAIQNRKDVELEILNSIEKLVDFPLSLPVNPAIVADLKASLAPFRPSDFDCLTEERNIESKCGYPLCPDKPRQAPNRRLLKLVQDYELQMGKETGVPGDWCSEKCKRRSVYIRVQLSHTPAWERGGQNAGIELLEEREGREERGKARREVERLEGNMKHLAIERGEAQSAYFQTSRSETKLKERVPGSGRIPEPPSYDSYGSVMHGVVEGHAPRSIESLLKAESRHNDSDEDMDDLMDTL